MQPLRSEIERLFAAGADAKNDPRAGTVFRKFRESLTRGEVRAAEKRGDQWHTNVWVKQGILLGFRLGELAMVNEGSGLSFVDKDTFPARQFTVEDRVRVVPGGSSIREGAYVSPGVVCMPPMYINVGAYVDEKGVVRMRVLDK